MFYKITKPTGEYTILDNTDEVYDYIVERIFHEPVGHCSHQAHNEAANAEGWCDVAEIGEVYDGGDFTVECIDH